MPVSNNLKKFLVFFVFLGYAFSLALTTGLALETKEFGGSFWCGVIGFLASFALGLLWILCFENAETRSPYVFPNRIRIVRFCCTVVLVFYTIGELCGYQIVPLHKAKRKDWKSVLSIVITICVLSIEIFLGTLDIRDIVVHWHDTAVEEGPEANPLQQFLAADLEAYAEHDGQPYSIRWTEDGWESTPLPA